MLTPRQLKLAKLLVFGDTSGKRTSRRHLPWSEVSRIMQVPVHRIRRAIMPDKHCTVSIQNQTPTSQNSYEEANKADLEAPVSKSSLNEQASMSLNQRVMHFQKVRPGRIISLHYLREIYAFYLSRRLVAVKYSRTSVVINLISCIIKTNHRM